MWGFVDRKVVVAGEFEFIPNNLSVIVLEDSAAPEPEADDPWECVDWDEDDPDGDHTARRAPSYAEVVATAI